MRRIAALASAAAAGLAALLTFATPATAAGATSVLVVSPGSGESAALYTTSDTYGELSRLLGSKTAKTCAAFDSKAPANARAGRRINVTWMMHDISVWRVDRVYPDAQAGAVWIRTESNDDGAGHPHAVEGYWHKAKEPAKLKALLDDLGVMGPASRSGREPALTYPPDAGRQDEAMRQPPPPIAPSEASEDGAGWWWTLPGFAGGVLIGCCGTALARRWVSARAADEPGPRRQLLGL